jgi:hypothetical protein
MMSKEYICNECGYECFFVDAADSEICPECDGEMVPVWDPEDDDE